MLNLNLPGLELIRNLMERKKDFECTTCHKGFKNNSNLKRHVSFFHEDGKRHSCPKCGKSFVTKEYVKEHVEVVHEGKKPYKCDYCDVCSGRKSDLKSHVTFKHKNVFTKSTDLVKGHG